MKQKLRSNILQRLVKSLNDIENVSEESQQAVELLRKAASQEYEFMSETGEHYDQLAKAVILGCSLKEIQEYRAENYFLSPWDFDLFDVSFPSSALFFSACACVFPTFLLTRAPLLFSFVGRAPLRTERVEDLRQGLRALSPGHSDVQVSYHRPARI